MLQNYHDDPVDGLFWSKVETKKRKSYCNNPVDDSYEQSQNPKSYCEDPVDEFHERLNEGKK